MIWRENPSAAGDRPENLIHTIFSPAAGRFGNDLLDAWPKQIEVFPVSPNKPGGTALFDVMTALQDAGFLTIDVLELGLGGDVKRCNVALTYKGLSAARDSFNE